MEYSAAVATAAVSPARHEILSNRMRDFVVCITIHDSRRKNGMKIGRYCLSSVFVRVPVHFTLSSAPSLRALRRNTNFDI